jgi:hypothetical protein
MATRMNTADLNSQSHFWMFTLMLMSAAAIAGSSGLLELPEYYRTPLSDVIYDEHPSWRAEPEVDNGWRRGDDNLIQQGQRRKEVLPRWDYEEQDDPTLGNIFMNQYWIQKPKTNVFRYNF